MGSVLAWCCSLVVVGVGELALLDTIFQALAWYCVMIVTTSLQSSCPSIPQLLPNRITILKVPMYLSFGRVIEPQDGDAVIEKSRIESTQFGHVEGVVLAVVKPEQESAYDATLSRVTLSDRHQSV
ncbi:hypothetical protein [Pseudomonas sp. NFACC36]|uniref:hypothetical protein n=1 Tax=Pseudomonas sp. NFACC36 TaxID=1566197 RepID=UPI0012E8DC96